MGLRQELLQLGVLRLELLQAARVRSFHPAVLRLPAIETLLRDPVTTRDLLNRSAGLLLSQDPDDLLFRKTTPHSKSYS